MNGKFRVVNVALPWLLLAVAGAAQPADDSWRQAEKVVQQTSDSVLKLIDESKGYAQQDPERFYKQVEALLSPVVDFRRFAGSVMATYYKRATPEQRKRFAESFKWGLVRTYGLALSEFNDGTVKVVPATRPPPDPNRVSVQQEITASDGQVYPVIYSMARDKKTGEWKVRNLIVNGVNMGLTYRSQFLSAAQDPKYGGDLDKVIDAWGDLLEAEAERKENAEAGTEQTQAQAPAQVDSSVTSR